MYMNGSCHTYERVTSNTWMSHVTYVNVSYRTCESVMLSHVRISHVTHMCIRYDTYVDESCHTHVNKWFHVCGWVMSHICEYVMSRMWMSHVTHMWVSYFFFKSCHTYGWVMSHICKDVMSHMWMNPVISHVCRRILCVTRLLVCHVTHMDESCRTYVKKSCHICRWILSSHTYVDESYVWHDFLCVMSHIWMSHVAHM